ncbi:MAG: UvrD-helicase domain-containing protein [Tissierellia bacterium]|nr:UvrD-helicase domain-containing protein [Fermentimonas sp.]MDD4436575.1 UvrD-helicase domain-containing protein [Tissierellia bacterium]
MNKIILAPAGGRKTQSIIELCHSGDGSKKRLIVTYTTTGQNVIEERLWQNRCSGNQFEVLGWYSFLLKHFIYPYVYNLYPEQVVTGLNFVEGEDPTRYKRGTKRYFDSSGRVYSNNIGKLALDIAHSSKGACLERLQGIYDEIYFDEVQDLGGNDLEILQLLLQSKIKIIAVGDVRQSILRTSRTDRKNNKYHGLQKILWFRKMESRGLCEVEEITSSWRCNQMIIDFADSILPKDLNFSATKSLQSIETDHDGVFVVSWGNLQSYLDSYSPECYRYNIKSKILEGTEAINFGLCKGKTVPRVLIYPTEPMKKFLKNSESPLSDQAASLFYVAITRAMYSVAIVVENPKQYEMIEWVPDIII